MSTLPNGNDPTHHYVHFLSPPLSLSLYLFFSLSPSLNFLVALNLSVHAGHSINFVREREREKERERKRERERQRERKRERERDKEKPRETFPSFQYKFAKAEINNVRAFP
jgi:hypothetical protein